MYIGIMFSMDIGQRKYSYISIVFLYIFLQLCYVLMWQLSQETRDGDINQKVLVYQQANKEVKEIVHSLGDF